MDVKMAVKRAKEIITAAYEDEQVQYVGLEEVDYDQKTNQWHVTIGFVRLWHQSGPPHRLPPPMVTSSHPRTYKVVSFSDDSSNSYSIKNREVAA